jgi:hypothetical protein
MSVSPMASSNARAEVGPRGGGAASFEHARTSGNAESTGRSRISAIRLPAGRSHQRRRGHPSPPAGERPGTKRSRATCWHTCPEADSVPPPRWTGRPRPSGDFPVVASPHFGRRLQSGPRSSADRRPAGCFSTRVDIAVDKSGSRHGHSSGR